MVLVEVLAQLSVHPIPETYIHQIEDFAFKHFRAQEAILDRSVCSCRVEEEEGRGVQDRQKLYIYILFCNPCMIFANGQQILVSSVSCSMEGLRHVVYISIVRTVCPLLATSFPDLMCISEEIMHI